MASKKFISIASAAALIVAIFFILKPVQPGRKESPVSDATSAEATSPSLPIDQPSVHEPVSAEIEPSSIKEYAFNEDLTKISASAVLSRVSSQLGLTDKEKEKFSSILTSFSLKRSKIESELMRIDSVASGNLFLSVNPYPDIGSKLKNELYAELEKQLGAKFIEQLGIEKLNATIAQKFGQFGLAQQMIDVHAIKSSEGGTVYMIEREFTLPEGSSPPPSGWFANTLSMQVDMAYINGTEFQKYSKHFSNLVPSPYQN